jgi:hypothetical protein
VLDYQQQVKKLVMGQFKEEEMNAAGQGHTDDAGVVLVRQVSAMA